MFLCLPGGLPLRSPVWRSISSPPLWGGREGEQDWHAVGAIRAWSFYLECCLLRASENAVWHAVVPPSLRLRAASRPGSWLPDR